MNYAEEYIAVVQGTLRGTHRDFRLLDFAGLQDTDGQQPRAQRYRRDGMRNRAYSALPMTGADER